MAVVGIFGRRRVNDGIGLDLIEQGFESESVPEVDLMDSSVFDLSGMSETGAHYLPVGGGGSTKIPPEKPAGSSDEKFMWG